MKIIGISGSIREQSLNTYLLKAAANFVPHGIEFDFVEINTIGLYNEDIDIDNKPLAVKEYLEKVANADVILFSSPEYNHGMSGVLKNAIDWASRPAFKSPLLRKPCGILTASKSPVGGARAQADLKNVLSSTLSVIYPAIEYLLPKAHEKFDVDGRLVDPVAIRHLQQYIEGLVSWANSVNQQNKDLS
jgi:chromate reductase